MFIEHCKHNEKEREILSFTDEEIETSSSSDNDDDDDDSIKEYSEEKKFEYFINDILVHMNVITVVPCEPY